MPNRAQVATHVANLQWLAARGESTDPARLAAVADHVRHLQWLDERTGTAGAMYELAERSRHMIMEDAI